MVIEDFSELLQKLRGLEQRKEAILSEVEELNEELVRVEPSRVDSLKQRIEQLLGEYKEQARVIEEMIQNSRKGGD